MLVNRFSVSDLVYFPIFRGNANITKIESIERFTGRSTDVELYHVNTKPLVIHSFDVSFYSIAPPPPPQHHTRVHTHTTPNSAFCQERGYIVTFYKLYESPGATLCGRWIEIPNYDCELLGTIVDIDRYVCDVVIRGVCVHYCPVAVTS